ncbi:uncharacterized protein LOC133206293 [Saccostrea echinata]|uniref:uncharacterized protein LOC133206293 n=1 Tax=Saccostrea echinata TaxID=191078 RepID=UPI002A813717|nr:uncharacterized protein LOC133206293 [Saccostrea echinata]
MNRFKFHLTVGVIVVCSYLYFFNHKENNENVFMDYIPLHEINASNLRNKEFIQCPERRQKLVKSIYTFKENKWIKNFDVCAACFKFPKAFLKTEFGITPIFVYERSKDMWVSSSLKERGSFESEKSSIIFKMMKEDPLLQLIDIGANIGVYTLSVAKAGRKVLAVEALDRNIQHICASAMKGNLHKNIILVHNAISNEHAIVNLGVERNNMGGTFVDVDADYIKKLKLGRAKGIYGKVNTITMDDLLDLPEIKYFQNVILKMDIEGFEAKALEKSSKFFSNINVVAFIMEWEFHRGQKTANKIIEYMTSRKFKPHSVNLSVIPLDVAKNASWGFDVLWLPN